MDKGSIVRRVKGADGRHVRVRIREGEIEES